MKQPEIELQRNRYFRIHDKKLAVAIEKYEIPILLRQKAGEHPIKAMLSIAITTTEWRQNEFVPWYQEIFK